MRSANKIVRLTTKRGQLERWKEHFNEVLNQPEPGILLDLSNEHVRALRIRCYYGRNERIRGTIKVTELSKKGDGSGMGM